LTTCLDLLFVYTHVHSFAASFWIYSTMDNIDGKQARRTNSSSPLGELFDHGCDALNCPIGGIVQIAALGLGFSWRSLAVLFITCWGFYLPTWEEYHTGILTLGYVNGPTEGLLAAMLTMIISGVFGTQIWFKEVGVVAGYHLAVIDLVLVGFMSLFLFYYVPSCVWAVKMECREQGKSFSSSLYQLSPMLVGTAAVAFWTCSRYSLVMTESFILFFTTVGIAFGKLATKIIYAHVAKCPFPIYTGLMLPLLVGAALMNCLNFAPVEYADVIGQAEWTFICCYFVICVVGYANWIYHTIHSICLHCDIYCLSIKVRDDETGAVESDVKK
jgi:ethanolaminephosphotransferase